MSTKPDYEIVSANEIKTDLTLTGSDIERVVAHLAIVKEAVSKVMKEGINNDYAVIPGTGKKKSLLKPGAEKLMKLFGLGARLNLVSETFERDLNFAMFTYNCEVFHLRTGVVIANCEGTANSQEKKYRDKAVYKEGIEVGREIVLACDILNTLRKMAQKRAMVGAVIIATGASDYFTQDEDEIENQQPKREKAKTVNTSKFRQDTSNLGSYRARVGKFNGKTLSEIPTDSLTQYIQHVTTNNPHIDGVLKEFLDKARDYLKTQAA